MNRRVDRSRAVFLWRLAILVALGCALALWIRRPALAFYHLEAGGQALSRAETFLVAHPAADNASLDAALRHYQKAVELAPTDAYAYRRLGEAWLLAGNNNAAQQVLSRAVELRPHDPMIHIDLGRAWDGLGEAEKAVAEYERGGYGPAKEKAIVNYLKLADWQIAAGGGDVALEILKGKILSLDPQNLPALNRVATIYEGMSQEGAASAAPIRQQMKQFAQGSVAVSSSTALAGYLAQAMISLTEDGTWVRDTLLNVVAYQVWQFAEGATGQGTEQILQTLVEHWPDDVDLRFNLAELYHRRGDLDQAEAEYRRVLERDPKYAAAMLRLGMVSEARSSGPTSVQELKDAATWYEEYHAAAPYDLLGLKRLLGVYETLRRPEAATLRQELEVAADDRRLAAQELGVPVAQVRLGPNLVENGGFETWQADGSPRGWIASDMFNEEPFGEALFVSGADTRLAWDGRLSARIAGLWQDCQPNQSRPRAGFWAWSDEQAAFREIPVRAGKWYVISLTYRSPDDNMSIWMAEKPGVLFEADRFLPTTQDSVRHYVAVFQSQVGGTIRPLVRYWGAGSVWFDDVAVREVVMDGP